MTGVDLRDRGESAAFPLQSCVKSVLAALCGFGRGKKLHKMFETKNFRVEP